MASDLNLHRRKFKGVGSVSEPALNRRQLHSRQSFLDTLSDIVLGLKLRDGRELALDSQLAKFAIPVFDATVSMDTYAFM